MREEESSNEKGFDFKETICQKCTSNIYQEQNDGIGEQFSVKSTEPKQLKTFFYCLRFEIILISLSKLIYEQAKNLNEIKQI